MNGEVDTAAAAVDDDDDGMANSGMSNQDYGWIFGLEANEQ